MSYRFEDGESAGEGLRRIAREQVEKALGETLDEDLDRHATVHQVRKRCKIAEPPKRLRKRFGRYWKVWREPGPVAAELVAGRPAS
jgi:hypothetical protein